MPTLVAWIDAVPASQAIRNRWMLAEPQLAQVAA
jgi:hypothetical protein